MNQVLVGNVRCIEIVLTWMMEQTYLSIQQFFLLWFIFSHLLNLLCIHVCITQASICIQFLNSVSVSIEPKPLFSAENIRSRDFWVWAWLEIFETGQSKFGCLMIDISLACVVGSTEVWTGIVGCKFSSICIFLVLNYVYELLLY